MLTEYATRGSTIQFEIPQNSATESNYYARNIKGEKVWRHTLSRIQMEVGSQLHAMAALTPRKAPPGTRYVGDRVDPRANLGALEKKASFPLPKIESRIHGRTTHNLVSPRLKSKSSNLSTVCCRLVTIKVSL